MEGVVVGVPYKDKLDFVFQWKTMNFLPGGFPVSNMCIRMLKNDKESKVLLVATIMAFDEKYPN